MEVTEEHIRHIMLCKYQQGKMATTAVKKIKEVYGNGVFVFGSVNDGFENSDKVTSACKMPQPRPTKIHATKTSTETRSASLQNAVKCLVRHVWCHTL